jgi:zinc transport system ATP-binding protein
MSSPLLTLDHIAVSYDHKAILSDVTLTVSPGDFVVLNGPNGGGKTTLLRLMAGLIRPTSGTLQQRRGLHIGYLPQYRNIDRHFPITVGEVVRSGLVGRKALWHRFSAAHRGAVDALLQRLDLADLARRPIAALSGGQWQRTLLGRALVSNPDLLLLDEPDTHLDSENRHLLYALLGEEYGRRAIVIVSHDPEVGTLFHRRRLIHVQQGHAFQCSAPEQCTKF